MNDDILRAGLDQSLLAMAELDGGDVAKAQAHVDLASVLMSLVGERGNKDQSTLRWMRDIREFEPITHVSVEAEVDLSKIAMPGMPTGRERAMQKREEKRLQSRS